MKSNSNKNKSKKRPQSSKVKSSNYLNQPKAPSSYKKEDSISFFPKEINSPNHVSSQFPSLDRNNRSRSAVNDSNELKTDSLNEEYAIIQKVWEDLGVTYKYRVQFDNYIRTVSESSLKNIFYNEKKHLAKFRESLMKLSKEITSRENNIGSLKKYIFTLLNSVNYFENEEDEKQKRNKDSIILDIVGIIKSLRLNSVNVITHFLKVREISTYFTLVNKIDMKAISEDYNYDENYLKKMRDDMDFLKECKGLQKYFVMNNGEIDAFLTNFAPRTNSNESYSKINSNKVKIPVSDELNKFINQCRYILIQESFFENIMDGGVQINFKKRESKEMNDFNNNNNSFIFNRSNISSSNNKKNVSYKLKSNSPLNSKIQFFKDDDENVNIKVKNYINNAENKEISKLLNNDKQDNIMMARNLEFLRKKMGREYNNLFLSNQDKNQIFNKKNNNNNIFPYNDMHKENLFRKPAIGNQIVIEREEKREKTKSDFKLQNNFLKQKESPLSQENEELKTQLNDVCFENESLKNEIEELKKYVKSLRDKSNKENEEREMRDFKKNREIEKMEKDNELKLKDLDHKNENLIKEKNDLNQEIKKTKTLMEKNEEESKKKINEINNLMQKQKTDLEKIIEEKNNKINELTNSKDKVIREKEEIIRQKEEIIKERDQLIAEKAKLEENISNLETKIGELQKEIENWKNDYKNLDKKENDMENKIKELNGVIEGKDQEKKNLINETNNIIGKLNDEISQWQNKLQNSQDLIDNMKNEIAMMVKEKDALNNEKNNLQERIKTLSNENSKIKEDNNNLTQKKNELEKQINNLNQEILELNREINNLKFEINDLKEKMKKNENNINNTNIINKEDEKEEKDEIDSIEKEKTFIIKGDYKYDFYKDNLFNLTSSLERSLPFDKIPDFMKLSFDLNDINIYEESTYMKGVYPKIIISTLKDSDIITGICSIYYENYGQMEESLILRIGALCVTENNWDEQIENIINYIKDKMDFDELKYVIKYMPSPEHENKLRINQKIKDLFKEKLNCVWKNLTNLADGSRTQDIRMIKQGNYFSQEELDLNKNNSELFEFNSLSILSLFDNDNFSDFRQKFCSIGFNEYINLFPIFVLLANNPIYTMFFVNENDKNIYELPEEDDPEKNNGIENPKNQIRKFSDFSMNLSDITNLKEKISSLELSRFFDLDESKCQEMCNKFQSQGNNFSISYFSMNLNLSTTTNYCLEYENYYYNRISSKKIDIFQDPETKNYFYLIPTRTEATFILICQFSKSLKQDLLDKSKNLYQAFMEFHPRLTSQILKFSSIIGSGIQQVKEEEKIIYIPAFNIETHLFSESPNDISKKGNITNQKTGAEGCVGSIDEYLRMSFEPDKNIYKGFTIVPAEDGKTQVIIKDAFLFAVFNTNIIPSTPLQLFYVTKDHWIKSKI